MTSTTTRPGAVVPEDPTFEELATGVDAAATAVEALDPAARKAAEQLRSAVEAAHRGALVTIVRRLREDETGRQLLFELVDDPLVRMLFSLHGIIRPDPLTQARAVLATVRPGLQSHGGDVELVNLDEGIAYVRLSGACNGCSMASVTMRNSVEEALVRGVPSITAVQIVAAEPGPTIIPLSATRTLEQTPQEAAELGWVKAGPLADFVTGEVTEAALVTADGRTQNAIVVRLGTDLSAYVDVCAHQGLPLGGALLDAEAGTLTCPWHGFCFDARSGDCMSAPGAALQPLPLRVDDANVWIRVEP
jgi:Fe-S cluster biogenesis protein NfuA/nitrite reductase/ring-hydroxylating ferredoxin subunit